jgi:ABC-type glutathione transport system ATPase component
VTGQGPLLQVDGLTIRVGNAPQPLVDGVSFALNPGETL